MISRLIVMYLLFLWVQVAAAQNYQDCNVPFQICEMKTYNFGYLNGYGQKLEAISNSSCFTGTSAQETNSIWLKWDIVTNGTLTFILNPEIQEDDIDFILYSYNDDCDNLKEVRCMASGEELGSKAIGADCLGNTGLSFNSVDEFEKRGCKYNDDNFLKFLSVEKGEKYLLLVNNYSSKSGFSISFEGDTKFKESLDCQFVNPNEEISIVSVFPNPTSEELNIQFVTHSQKEYDLQLLEVSGRQVFSSSETASIGLNLKTLDVEYLPPGTYILVVSSEGYSTAKRFVKN